MHYFNVRVYGILTNDQEEVLVSDEYIRGEYYTKLPGGGLEFGEGTRDCLKREFMEEMALEVEIGDHIYTTDFFQLSAFNSDHQMISIYYYAKALAPITVPLRTKPFDFDEHQLAIYQQTKEIETFRFVKWNELAEDTFTLPIDRHVARILKR